MQLRESQAKVRGIFSVSCLPDVFLSLQDLFKISKKAGLDIAELEVTFVHICTIVLGP